MLSTAKHLAAAKVSALSNTLCLAPIHRINRDRVLMSKSANPILTQSEQFWSFEFCLLELV